MSLAFAAPISLAPCLQQPRPLLTDRGATAKTHIPRRRRVQTMASVAPLSPAAPAHSAAGNNPVFAQVMLRIRDPKASVPFYELLGMREVTRVDFPTMTFSLIFLAYADEAITAETPQARASALWSLPYPTVELTWNWPAEDAAPEHYVSGNEEPRGFGHLSIVVGDANAAVERLRAGGVHVLREVATGADGVVTACVKDPDGYHVEITQRDAGPGVEDPVFAGAMLRVKDPVAAVTFFERLGFRFLTRIDNDVSSRSEFYMAYTDRPAPAADASMGEKQAWVRELRSCTLKLTHEWGTEESAEQMYAHGNEKPNRGFGHVGVLVDDIYTTVSELAKDGYKVIREPGPFGGVAEFAFVAEPSTGYWVEIIKREGKAAARPYEKPVLGA